MAWFLVRGFPADSSITMGSRICLNALCRATATPEWKRGWALRYGGFADLCYHCGCAYETSLFCDTFHINESGWRQCSLCSKRLHCGCVASKSLIEFLDYGGVACINCTSATKLHSVKSVQIHRDGIHSEFGLSKDNIGVPRSSLVHHKMDCDGVGRERAMQLSNIVEASNPYYLPQSQKGDAILPLEEIKEEDIRHSSQELCAGFPELTQFSVGSSKFGILDENIGASGLKDVLTQPSCSISLTAPSIIPDFVRPAHSSKASSPFQLGQIPRHILPKPSKSGLIAASESNNKRLSHQLRISRSPADGRGRNQLLPRYWPRITEQELQQLSGDLNSTIVPLFEKVLSASDAGRIGRLVLPKACAEAYFPPISQSEGCPLKIQDAKGKEWTFQFRFWPNNNSRMYVLEGVTPCIQSMQLQAGDTVTFSQIDPGGKLIMGFRKALNSAPVQDAPTSCVSTGTLPMESLFPRDTESIQNGIGCSSLEQCLKGSTDSQLNTLSEPTSADENAYWHMKDKHGGKVSKESLQHPFLDSEQKRSRNIGCKSKRLLIHSEDALKLRVTWEEAQDLLRPPPSVKPSIVLVENHEFEEYDEPPVFGKRTFFIAGLSGEQEQWTECDDCSKWRRLPLNVLLPPKWTCCENVWDLSRCSCTVPEEARPKEVEKLFGMRQVLKKQRTSENRRPAQDHEPSGLDALATAAVLGDDEEPGGAVGAGAEAATTTKHPRHRSGCTCIVCIQPPSGKGKHKSSCACNVCTTVRRRFKTLMMRRRLRHSERDAVVEVPSGREESDADMSMGQSGAEANPSESERSEAEEAETDADAVADVVAAGHIDLNCHPGREEELLHPEAAGGGGLSMVSLVKAASLPLDLYLKENGLTSLIQTEEAVLDGGSPPVTEVGGGDEEEEEQQPEEGLVTPATWEPEEGLVTPATWEPSGGVEELCHEPGLD